ncbi:MAG: glycosyltransferase family 2 protein, partial [Candidatus Aenigmatarchaeota archaeon]
MEDPILLFSGMLFLFLFAVLGLMFVITLAASFKKRTWKSDHEPHVSIVIPAYNEEKNIGKCLEAIQQTDYPEGKKEVIVVDDGSKDRTVEIARNFKDVKIARQEHNGKVDALNLGVSKASRNIVITIDSDVMMEKDFIRNIAKPFSDPDVGAVSGAAKVANTDTILTAFQSIEYIYNSLLMDSFSKVFGTSLWFWGALSSFRKDVLLKVGGFKKTSETEDFDTMIRIKRHGYKTVSTKNAMGRVNVPSNMVSLFKQRIRWWKGSLQTISKNLDMFRPKHGIAIMLLIFTQFFWFVYSFLIIPLIAYQILYWIPYNSATLADLSFYLFRWFNLVGPFYALYKIP